MSDPDPVVPRVSAPGTRAPVRGDTPRTLGGTLATVALLLGLLVAAAAPPALLVGILLGVVVGGGAIAVSQRRATAESTQICVPKVGVCVRL